MSYQPMRHTLALPRSSRWERLYFRVFGRNHPRVVRRRLEAYELDRAESEAWQRSLAAKGVTFAPDWDPHHYWTPEPPDHE